MSVALSPRVLVYLCILFVLCSENLQQFRVKYINYTILHCLVLFSKLGELNSYSNASNIVLQCEWVKLPSANL